MRPVGGFFELELPPASGEGYHPGALALTSGRACVARLVERARPGRVHVPFFCCDSLVSPLRAAGVEVAFYGLDRRLRPRGLPPIGEREALIYIDYFGLQGQTCRELVALHRSRAIIDDTQNFFQRARGEAWSFHSARKFFGVPDGAYLYGPDPGPPPAARRERLPTAHLLERLLGNQSGAYALYVKAEAEVPASVLAISSLSERLLSGVDYPSVMQRRRRNFAAYAAALGPYNTLDLSPLEAGAVPFCYPLLPARGVARERLYAQQIFVPTLWPDVLTRPDPPAAWELELAGGLLPLPVDHRYGDADCARVIAAVRDCLRPS